MNIIVLFALLGLGLKLVDEAFDKNLYSKKLASVLALFLSFLWIYLSLLDPYSGTILTSILLGSLLTGKIDNPAFQVASGFILLALFLSGAALDFSLLLFLTTASAIDEKLHGRFQIFKIRPMLKLAVLTLLPFIPLINILAFFSFDLSYDIAGFLTGKSSAIKRLTRIASEA